MEREEGRGAFIVEMNSGDGRRRGEGHRSNESGNLMNGDG